MGSGCFAQTGLETTRTSPKALTDKPLKPNRQAVPDKQTGLEKHTEYTRPDVELVLLVQFLMNFWEKRGSSVNQ